MSVLSFVSGEAHARSIILFRPKNGGKSEKKKLEKIQKGEKTPEQQKSKQKGKEREQNSFWSSKKCSRKKSSEELSFFVSYARYKRVVGDTHPIKSLH